MMRVGRLNEDRRFVRIDPDGQPIDQHLVHEFPDPAGIGIVCGKRVPIRHKEKTFVLVLQRFPIIQRAQQIPQMEEPAGLHAADNFFLAIAGLPYFKGADLSDDWC